MTWGARSLARNAAMILLLKVLSPYAAATQRSSAASGTRDTYTAVALANRGKRESNSMPDILIEHVDDDGGELPFFPLLVGLMVMGCLIVLILLLLACHLLLRLAESKCAKYRYRRLRAGDPETGYRTSLPAKPSHVFTYVDLSYNECAHADHDEEENRAPRFGVNFNTAAKVDGSDGDLRREQRRIPIPAPRRSQPLRMGLPTGDKEEATDSAPVHQERADEGVTSSQAAAAATTENPDEPPKKKICSQHVAHVPRSRSGGLNDEGEFNVFVERCTQFKSVAPEFEINVRDRTVRGRPHGGIGSPRRSGLAGVTEEVVPGMWAETNQAYYPGRVNTHSRGYGRALDSYSNTPYNLYETISQSHSLDGINLSIPDDSTSQQTSAHEQHGTSMSGHGRYYEQHALEESGNKAIVSGANHHVQPNIDSESKVQDRPAAVLAPSSHDGPHSTLVEVPGTEVSTYRSPSTSSLKSPRSLKSPSPQEDEAYEARESAVSAQKSSETSNALGRPIHLDMTLVLPGVASPQTSAQGTPLEPRSSEMRVPQMIAYFDKPPTVQRFKAKLDGSTTECSVPNRPRYSSVPSEALSEKDMLVSLPSPGKTVLVNETIKLPEPPPDQLYLKSPDRKSAVAVSALQSVRKRHDVQDTTEPFSVDETSQRRASGSELLSATDMSSGRVDTAKSRSRSSLVLAHSQPSMETSPVAHVERSVSTHSRPAVAGSISSLGTNDLVKERDQDLHAVEVTPSPSKQSVDAIPTSILPTNEELPYEAASHVQASQERTKAGAALVSPVDTPEYRALAPPESSFHLEEITPAGMPAHKSGGATIAVKEDGFVDHPAQREVTLGDTALDKVEAHGRAMEAGGTHPLSVISKQDAVATRERMVPPAMISSGIGQASLVTKEPLEVNLSTKETDLEAQVKTSAVKQRSPPEANAPYPSQDQTPVPDRDNVVLSRVENEVPSHKADTSVLETELAGRLALATHDDKPTELSATAPPHVLVHPTPLPSRGDTMLSRADNEVPAHRDEAGTGVVETEAVGKPISRNQQPPFPREEEASLDSSDTKAKSTVAEKRIFAEQPQLLYNDRRGEDLITVSDPGKSVLESRSPKKLFPASTPRPPDIRSTPADVIAHTPVSSAQDQESTAVAIRREQKVPEEQHTGPFSDSNRRVSESSLPHKQVDARFPSNRHRRSLDDPSSFDKRDKLSEQKSSNSWVESSASQPRPLSSMHSLRSSAEPSHLSKDYSTGTHSTTTFLLNPDLPEGEDNARREIVSGLPLSVSEVEPTSQAVASPHDKLPPHLFQSNITALSIANQSAPPGSPRKGSISLSQAQHSLPNPNLPKERSGTGLLDKNVLLDSSVVPPYRRRKASGGKLLPRTDSNKSAGSLETLGSSSSKSLEVQSQRESALRAINGANKDYSVTSVAPLESKTDSLQAAVQIPRGEMSIGRHQGEVTSASHHSAVQAESKPTVEVSADQRKQLTPKPRDSRQVSLPPSESELSDQPKVSTIQPAVTSRKLLTSGVNELLSARQPSSVQLAGAPRTLDTRDKDGLAIAPSDSLDAAARQVRPLDAEISREPSAVQLTAPSGTLATSGKSGLPIALSDSLPVATRTVRPSEKAELDTSVEPRNDHSVQSGTEISRRKPSLVQLAAAPRTLETRDKDGLAVAPSDSLEAAARQVRPREGPEANTGVEPQEEYRVPSDAEISRRQPSTVQPADALRTLATSDKNGLPISLKDSSTAATRAVGASEVSESNTSVQPHKDHHPVPSDAEISQREPSAVQLAAAPRTLEMRDKDGLAIAPSDSLEAATRQVRPREGSEPNTSIQPHKDYPVPSDAGTSREQSSVQQAAAPRTLVMSDKSGLPVSLSDSSAAAERFEQDTSLAPHQMHSELSEVEASRPLVAKERPPSADVFFGRTSPVQAHGSKDLIVLQADPTNDASSPQEKRADEEHTDIDKPPASNDKTEQSKK